MLSSNAYGRPLVLERIPSPSQMVLGLVLLGVLLATAPVLVAAIAWLLGSVPERAGDSGSGLVKFIVLWFPEGAGGAYGLNVLSAGVLGSGILITGAWALWRGPLLRGSGSILSLVWLPNGQWEWRTRSGARVLGQLIPGCRVYRHLLLLRLRSDVGRWHCVLFADGVKDPDAFRRAVVRLRTEGLTGQAPRA